MRPPTKPYTVPLSTAIGYIDPYNELGYRARAAKLGIHYAAYKRWNEIDQITMPVADKIAKHLNLHPVMIWGKEYNDWVPTDAEVERASEARTKKRTRQ